jgi:glycine/sarcosine N-methyltransferase
VDSYLSLQRALVDFAACLRPGGVLIIQNRNFDAVLDNAQRWMDPQRYADDRGEWLFVRFYDFEANGTLTFNMLTLQHRSGQSWTQRASSTTLLPIRHDRLVGEMQQGAFSKVCSYGDLQGTEYRSNDSPNHVVVARKAG